MASVEAKVVKLNSVGECSGTRGRHVESSGCAGGPVCLHDQVPRWRTKHDSLVSCGPGRAFCGRGAVLWPAWNGGHVELSVCLRCRRHGHAS